MPTIQLSVTIDGTPDRIWSIIIDPLLSPKMLPDVISALPEKSGPVEAGSVWTLVAKIFKRKVKLTTEAIEVIPNKKLVVKIRPSRVFKMFVSEFELERTRNGTVVTEKIEYSTSGNAIGESLSPLVINRHTKRNVIQGLSNLKELVELKEFEG